MRSYRQLGQLLMLFAIRYSEYMFNQCCCLLKPAPKVPSDQRRPYIRDGLHACARRVPWWLNVRIQETTCVCFAHSSRKVDRSGFSARSRLELIRVQPALYSTQITVMPAQPLQPPPPYLPQPLLVSWQVHATLSAKLLLVAQAAWRGILSPANLE